MKQDIDMSGVDPARLNEARRRIAILDEFTAMHRPSLVVRTEFARRIGLSVSQFLMLARVWRTTRDAAAVPGSRSRNARAGSRRLPARPLEIMRETIEALGPMARRKDVLHEVGRRCAAEGVAPPSDSTIANELADARARMAEATEFAPEILIDECVARLPVARGGAVVTPHLLLAIVLPERRIVAAEASVDPATPPSPTKLMTTLDAGDPVVAALRRRAPHHPEVEGGSGPGPVVGGPSLSRVLGNRLGDLSILHRASMARPGASLAAARHASPLGLRDAAKVIASAIAAHNATVPPLRRATPRFAP